MIGQYWALNYALQETCSPNHHAAICRASEHERIIVWQIGDWAAERHALDAGMGRRRRTRETAHADTG